MSFMKLQGGLLFKNRQLRVGNKTFTSCLGTSHHPAVSYFLISANPVEFYSLVKRCTPLDPDQH